MKIKKKKYSVFCGFLKYKYFSFFNSIFFLSNVAHKLLEASF